VRAVRPQRAHGAQEDLTALPQRPHSALSNTLDKQTPSCGVCFEHVQNKRSRRLRSVFTAFSERFHSVVGECTARTSAICNFF